MRELSYVGVGRDGDALIVQCDGEHFRLPLDERVQQAVAAGGTQLAIPVEHPLTPREIQERIRHGASAAEIAETTGVPIERIARYEGPVIAERAFQAESARNGSIDGRRLGDVVREYLETYGHDPAAAGWDAWRREDGTWLVTVSWPDGERTVRARWSWTPATRRLLPRDPLSQEMLHGEIAADDLTAVLRPVHAGRGVPTRLRPRVVPDRLPVPIPELEDDGPDLLDVIHEEVPVEPGPVREPAPDTVAVDGDEAVSAEDEPEEAAPPTPVRAARRGRRVSVPSWDQIAGSRRE